MGSVDLDTLTTVGKIAWIVIKAAADILSVLG